MSTALITPATKPGAAFSLRTISQYVLFMFLAIALWGCENTTTYQERQNDTNQQTQDKGSTISNGIWSESTVMATEGGVTEAPLQQLEISGDTVFLSWSVTTGSGEDLKLLRATVDTSGDHWNQSPYKPVGFNSSSISASFKAHSAMLGYALWENNGTLKVSEFMGDMSHFMGTADLGAGHAPRLLIDASDAHLVKQSHMTNGFGLDVVKRTGMNNWAAAVQLHRMGMDADNAISMPHESLITFVDGNHNIRAIWIETQAGATRLMTALYNTTDNNWVDTATILYNTNTFGIDLSTIQSMSASGEHGNANVHLTFYAADTTDQAIWTIDFDGTTWGEPQRRDPMPGMSSIIGGPAYAVYHNDIIIVWVEDHMGTVHIKSLRYHGAWGIPEDVAMLGAGATISGLNVALNHDAHAVATWIEDNQTTMHIAAAVQNPGDPWQAKELVAEYASGTNLNGLSPAMHGAGKPWIIWNVEGLQNNQTQFDIHLSKRLFTVLEVPMPVDCTPPSGDGHNHGGGNTTNDPCNPNGGGTGGDTGGGTGGDTGGGTGGDTGSVNPGGGTGSSTTDPNVDYATEQWADATELNMEGLMTASNPAIISQHLNITSDAASFLSWSTQTDAGEVLKVKRAIDAGNGYTWEAELQPMGISTSARLTSYTSRNATEGYALWEDNEVLYISEFMQMDANSAPHFMGTTNMGAGHAARILVDTSGVYLIKQSHMMNGFGLDVVKRNANGGWDAAVQLHRMGMDADNAISMPHDSLTTLVDGNHHIRAIWIETQTGAQRLMTALYNTTDNAWGEATPILDSTAAALSLDLLNVHAISASGEHGNANVHLAVYIASTDDQGIWTLDFDGTTWSEATRRDLMPTMTTFIGEPAFAVYHNAHLIAWVEDHMGTVHIKYLRYDGAWNEAQNIATPASGADVSQVGVTLNHAGHALATWVETDTNQVRLLNALQPLGGSWSAKELITAYPAVTMVQNLTGALHESGVPWVVWNVQFSMNDMTHFTTQLSQRTTPLVVDTGGDTGGGTGGDTGGNTGGGTGGDTGGSDPGAGTGSGSTDPNLDYATDQWGDASELASVELSATNNPAIISQRMDITSDAAVFLSWSTQTTDGEVLRIKRATDAGNGYTWLADMQPSAISANAILTSYTARSASEGYALWEDNEVLYISEFMDTNSMPHFMTAANVGSGHAARILVDSSGVYLINQSHMMNGFGLDVVKRNANGGWDAAVQLHRMGMDADNAISMPHDSLTTVVDGNHHIRVIWIETQTDAQRLMTALYNTTDNAWGEATPILDSAAGALSVDLLNVHAISASGEHGNANVHLALFVESTDDQGIWTLDFDGTVWNDSTRRDTMPTMTSFIGEPAFAVYHNAHLIAWVENHMGTVTIKSMRFDPTGGWNVLDVATPASGADVSQLGVTLNHAGHALATWVETDTNQVRLLNALQPLGGSWNAEELITAYSAGTQVQNLTGALHESGVPWVVWNVQFSMNDMIHFTTQLSQRNTPLVVDTGGGTGGNTGGGTGGNTGGGTGGDTGGGTGGDTGGSTGGGTDLNVAEGLWQTTSSVTSYVMPNSDPPAMISGARLQVTNSGNLFASWLVQSVPESNTAEFTQTDITIMRGQPDNNGGYTWSSPDSTMFNPANYTTSATDTQFVANPVTADAIATWNYNGLTYTSEFMGGMGHFMNSAQLEEGHATKVLVSSTGQVYLLAQTHMMGGFGLSVYKRTAADTWSSTPVQLHRMDMTNAFSLVNHFLIATVDGEDNIRAVWLEEHTGVLSLQTASYTTGNDTWGAVSAIAVQNVMLNRLNSAVLSGSAGNADLQLIMHQQNDMMHGVFAVAYVATDSSWGDTVRLDAPTTTTMMMSAPVIATNAAGTILVAWMEHDTGMNNMKMLMARRYMPGMGWHEIETISHAAMSAAVTEIAVSLNATGDATAVWIESTTTGSHVIASHKVAANTSWSQRELISSVATAVGSAQAVTVALDNNNVPLILWAVTSTDGVNDTLTIQRNARLTAIADASGNGADPGTGGGSGGGTDPGTGGGVDPGTTDPGAGGNDVPASVNWTTPVLSAQMMHSTSKFRFYGPQLVLDDIGGASIRMSMANTSKSEGTSLTTIGNHIVRSVDAGSWDHILMNSGLLDDLSNTALIEALSAIPTTGSLYGLIRDGEKLYLARYLPDVGWSKLEIPGVPAKISRKNLQLTTNDTGMVTITWHQAAATCCNVDLHAKHFMATDGWQETQTISVPAQSVLTPHTVDSDGTVHVAWLVDSATSNEGGFDMKMATYTPMVGWSEPMDGPGGLRSAITATMSNGENKLVVVTNLSTNTIDAYVITRNGSWSHFPNINQKVDGDGIRLTRHNETRVISGSPHHFMAVWREYTTSQDGDSTVRYNTVAVHHMTDNANMDMWHFATPMQVSGVNSGYESDLQIAMDSSGNAYAVWTSVDTAADTDSVYVSSAPVNGEWNSAPELLAEYDMTTGNYAGRTSIAVNTLGHVGIAWDRHENTSAMSMHQVWFIEKQ